MILIAADKFKGSLASREAGEAIASGLRLAGITTPVRIVEMADGGEGTPGRLAGKEVVVSADWCGYGNRTLSARPLMERSSFELGRHIADVLTEGIATEGDGEKRNTEIYVALGGTLTSDGGAGLLQTLGARFIDSKGKSIEDPLSPGNFHRVESVDLSLLHSCGWNSRITVLSDVRASLLPPGLSTLDFVAQKGGSPQDCEQIRLMLRRLRELTDGQRVFDRSEIDGAAGGLGFALASVIGAPWRQGAETVVESMGIDWNEVELVISGEGRIDNQTAGGKSVETMRRLARKHGVPFMAFGGYVEPSLRRGDTISTIEKPEDYSPSLARPRLEEAVRRRFLGV